MQPHAPRAVQEIAHPHICHFPHPLHPLTVAPPPTLLRVRPAPCSRAAVRQPCAQELTRGVVNLRRRQHKQGRGAQRQPVPAPHARALHLHPARLGLDIGKRLWKGPRVTVAPLRLLSRVRPVLQPARCWPLPDLCCMCMGHECTLPRLQTLTPSLGLTPVISSVSCPPPPGLAARPLGRGGDVERHALALALRVRAAHSNYQAHSALASLVSSMPFSPGPAVTGRHH